MNILSRSSTRSQAALAHSNASVDSPALHENLIVLVGIVILGDRRCIDGRILVVGPGQMGEGRIEGMIEGGTVLMGGTEEMSVKDGDDGDCVVLKQ